MKLFSKKGVEERRTMTYHQKDMQSELYQKQDKKYHLWLGENLTSRKTAAIMSMLHKMVETKAWKMMRGLTECDKCRLFKEQRETIDHLLARRRVMASSEYLVMHNKAQMILAVYWAKKHKFLDSDRYWYRENWKREHVKKHKLNQ